MEKVAAWAAAWVGAVGAWVHRNFVSGNIIVSALKMSTPLQQMSQIPKSLSGCACARFTECRKGAARAADTRWLGGSGAERTNIFPWLGKKKRLTVQSKMR